MSQTEPSLLGIWKLKAFYLEPVDGDTRIDAFGLNPRGVLMLHPDGRMCAVITPGEQPVPTTDAERAAAFGKLIAYSGRFRLEPPDRFVTSVDVAWAPDWVGTDQQRTFRLDGDKLDIVSAPVRLPNIDGLVRGVMAWEREVA